MGLLNLQAAAERGGYGGERYEKVEFQKKVEHNFKSLQDSTWQVGTVAVCGHLLF
jgi:dTMP kinase